MRVNKTSSKNQAKPIILAIIISSALVVIVALVASHFLKPELRVKSIISELTSDYYENYFHDKYIHDTSDVTTIQKETKNGLPPIPLHQLLLYDNQKNNENSEYLSSYCDLDSTYVTIYPEPPYDKKSYHADFSYSCNF